jgi:hypothetical protein
MPELTMANNATMTATPNEIITKLVKTEAAIKRQNKLAPEAILFAKKDGKSGNGGNASKVGKGSIIPNWNERDNTADRKDSVPAKSIQCQRRSYITKNCVSTQTSNPALAAATGVEALTQTMSTLTTSIENYWIVVCSNPQAVIGLSIIDPQLTSPAINRSLLPSPKIC